MTSSSSPTNNNIHQNNFIETTDKLRDPLSEKSVSSTEQPMTKVESSLSSLVREDFSKEIKDKSLTIRLSSQDRNSMEEVAKSLGISVAEYLIQLHRVAAKKILTGCETEKIQT